MAKIYVSNKKTNVLTNMEDLIEDIRHNNIGVLYADKNGDIYLSCYAYEFEGNMRVPHVVELSNGSVYNQINSVYFPFTRLDEDTVIELRNG